MQTPPARQGSSRPQYPIESVDRALRLLKMFRTEREIRLSDARRALDVGQSTAHRLMAMLCYHDFVTQDPVTRVYRAGPALMEIGLAAVRHVDVRELARPHLEALAATTDETVHLAALEGTQVRFLDAVESSLALRVSSRVGRVLPAHATSIGKAMLAVLPDDVLVSLYPEETLSSVTAKTTTRRSNLLDEIEHVRSRGYAVNDEESEDGVSSVGVSITDPDGTLIGGLSIAAPRSRLGKAKRPRLANLLGQAAEELGKAVHRAPRSA